MNLRFLGGANFNVLGRAAAITALAVTDENALFPRANLYDGAPSVPFRFSTAGATMTVTADLNLAKEGGFESAFVTGLPSGWVKSGTATVTQESSPVHAGAKAVSLTGGAAADFIYYDITVQAGEALRFDAWGRVSAGAVPAKIRLQNRHTGKWLKTDGTWNASAQDLLSTTATSYTQIALSFTVESFLLCNQVSGAVTLRVELLSTGTADKALYDDVYLWPQIDTCVLCGTPNLSPVVGVEWRSSTDNFAANDTLRATMTPQLTAFYSVLGAPVATDRYWRLKFTTADQNPGGALWIGEWVLGYSRALARKQMYGWKTTLIDPQRREDTDAGEHRAYLLTEGQRRRLLLEFTYDALASYQEARDYIFRVTRNGAYACVLVPDDSDAEVVCFGHVQTELTVSRELLTWWSAAQIILDESPLFTVVA